MKKLIIPMLFLLLISCSKSDSNPNIPKELLGKWQIVEVGSDVITVDENNNPTHLYVTTGFIYEFFNDGTFISNELNNYDGGIYSVNDRILNLQFTNGNTHLTVYKAIANLNSVNLSLNVSDTNTIPDPDNAMSWELYNKIQTISP